MKSNRVPLISSIARMRCPRCREGAMFPYAFYSARFMVMNKRCPCCGQSFVLEPGFFLGAAFFSYFINAVLLTAVALTLVYYAEEVTIGAMIITIVVIVFGLLPVTLRLSKSIWIHIFVSYEGPCIEIPKKD
jgi:uncharacterized protein (DUF983 family)